MVYGPIPSQEASRSPPLARRGCPRPPHSVLAPLSGRYPQRQGRLPILSSPFRHSHQANPIAIHGSDPVRLACLIHAASVRSEPESNSQTKQKREPLPFGPPRVGGPLTDGRLAQAISCCRIPSGSRPVRDAFERIPFSEIVARAVGQRRENGAYNRTIPRPLQVFFRLLLTFPTTTCPPTPCAHPSRPSPAPPPKIPQKTRTQIPAPGPPERPPPPPKPNAPSPTPDRGVSRVGVRRDPRNEARNLVWGARFVTTPNTPSAFRAHVIGLVGLNGIGRTVRRDEGGRKVGKIDEIIVIREQFALKAAGQPGASLGRPPTD